MAETEVESILREIRERVIAQQRPGRDVAAPGVRSTPGNESNGSDAEPAEHMIRQGDSAGIAAENLALINSYLTTTGRAWDRLPPLVSNRSGLAARIELWIKRHLKRATRWYAWEQVNFNAAVHHALRDVVQVLATYEQELENLRAQLDAEVDQRRVAIEQLQAEQTARRAEMRAEMRDEIRAEMRAELDAKLDAVQVEQRTGLAALRSATEAQRAELNVRLGELVKEMRERDERLEGEQRVSFKQLALENSEAAVLEDRARRKTEVLLEELRRRIEQLEKTDDGGRTTASR